MDIPGYRIQREIGRGGSSRVYLALQHAFGKPVAIKIAAPEAAQQADFRQRFLRIGELARQFDHPGIVRVFETGIHGGTLYQVMEYMRGGDLDANLETGMHMQNVLLAMKDIAAALDYIHRRGIVHCDVKPQNILFREQGSALLSDFGIAARIGECGGGGSPPYASPEQAAGRGVDARSDFYSLGVVFHRILTGSAPARDGAQPRDAALPLQYAPFQPVAARLLADAPDDRFQSGADIATALDAVRLADQVPDAMAKSAPVATADIEAAAAAGRQSAAASAAASPRSRALPYAVLAALLLAAVAVGGWYAASRGALERALAFAGLAEHPDAATSWAEADALRRDPRRDLAGIVAAYRRVGAFDAEQAQQAIDSVAAQWKQAVSAALDRGDLAAASAQLDEFAGVFPADPDITALYSRIGERRQAGKLLLDTRRLLARAGLSDAASVDAAIATYKEVLRLAPNDAEALADLDAIARHYGERAAEEAGRDVAQAMDSFRRAVSANAEFAGAAAVRARLSEAEALQAEIDDSLQAAADLRQSGALIAPPGGNPLEIYRRVLATDPDNALAAQGISEISAQVLARFDALLAAGRLDAARSYKDRAAASGIGDAAVAEMNARFQAELDRIATVKALIAEAEELYAEGYITGPSQQDNAVARLREALRLDPGNADGQRLLSVAATRLAAVAAEAYAAGFDDEGLRYLDLALTVTPGIGRWREQRDIWQAEIAARAGGRR